MKKETHTRRVGFGFGGYWSRNRIGAGDVGFNICKGRNGAETP
jgi:hypothetical protein